MKTATLIRQSALNVISTKHFLDDKEEMKRMITEIVEQNNDAKLGRIISLVFRVTSHVDVVKEQINVLFQVINNTNEAEEDEIDMYLKRRHPITFMAEDKIKERDLKNINRKKQGIQDYYSY